MVLTSAIAAANGLTLPSLVATVCLAAYILLSRYGGMRGTGETGEIGGIGEVEELKVEVEKGGGEGEGAKSSGCLFRLYRQAELRRIVASLLADRAILVVGEEGSGKSVLANAVVEALQNDGFVVAFVEPSSIKQMLKEIAEQIGVETQDLEGKWLTTEQLKTAIESYLAQTTAFIVIDDCNKCPSHFRLWLKHLRKQGVPMLLLATNPPKTDVFISIPRIELSGLSEYAIREIMEQAALDRGLSLFNSDLARLQERAGGNPMLAQKAIDEEYLGLEVEGADHNRYLDVTPLIVLVGVGFMVLRFVGLGTNNHALYIFSGIGAAIFLGVSRLLYNLPQESRRIQS